MDIMPVESRVIRLDQSIESWEYSDLPQDWVEWCPVCGWDSGSTCLTTERYGLSVGVSTCAECGFVYFNPQISPEAYLAFYASGKYRELVSGHHGRLINAETIKPEQEAYGKALCQFIAEEIRPKPSPWSLILDVGGSTGTVSRQFPSEDRIVVDPASAEIPHGAIEGTLELTEKMRGVADLVLCCQMIDHVPEPSAFLIDAMGCMTQGGYLWIDILDYATTREIKIDHPSNFTRPVLERLVWGVGLTPIADRAVDNHIGLLCKRST